MEMEAPFDGLLDEPNSNLGHPKLRSSVGSDQPRSQSSSAISDVTSPVKLVEKIRTRFQASSGNSDSANWPGCEDGVRRRF